MLETLSKQPILLALSIVIIVSIILTFVLPKVANLKSLVGWELFTHNVKSFYKTLQKHPLEAVLLLVVSLGILVGVFVLYWMSQPIKTLTASQVEFLKGKRIASYQAAGVGSFQTEKIYLIDARSREDFDKERLSASVNIPVGSAAKEFLVAPGVDMVVFSSSNDLTSAKKVAELLKKNQESYQGGAYASKVGQMFVVSDGYEALKAAGLKVENGAPLQ